jgi:two-component system chemotaxis response regulator CheB
MTTTARAAAREVFLQPGEYFAGDASHRIRTLLGSCISITLWSPLARVGAMSHCLLPTRGRADVDGVRGLALRELDARYADEALHLMLHELERRHVRASQCRAKVFGGGDMFPAQKHAGVVAVGRRNGEAARELLQAHGIELVSENLFGEGHRQMVFDVASGGRYVMSAIKVMVVDDSAVVRQVVAGLLGAAPGIEVLAAVADPVLAIERLKQAWPDVIVLDVEMPRMDGITFLRKLMAERPTPVVICSTLTEKGAKTTMEALAAGAVAIVTKPRLGLKQFLNEAGEELVATVRAAARANLRRVVPRADAAPPAPKNTADVILAPAGPRAMTQTTERVVALGTSTGGTQALEQVLAALPRVCPGIVIVQHMPEKFTAAFAERLDGLCRIEVREARNNDRVVPGRALIAPGGRHMLLKRSGAQYFVEVVDGPVVNRHRPSVDVLFRSVAKSAGVNALGVIMTGMGDDGAAGLAEMRAAGARTLAQDEESCVVFGMPKEAIKRGGVERSVPLGQIAAEIARPQ